MFYADEEGNITLRQGDSGTLVITGIDHTRNWKVYFAMYDSNRKPVGSEIMIYSNNNATVYIDIPAVSTDLLTVPKDEDYATYYYGVKLCNEGIEDTLVMGNGSIETENTITVYPRKVVGD